MRHLLTIAAVATFVSTAHATEPSLCLSRERVAFSCLLENGKVMSICASPNLSQAEGYVQYRYGSSRRVELEFPRTKTHTQKLFELEVHRPYGAESELLNFTVGKFSYSVFRVVSSEPDAPTWAGVTVTDSRNSAAPITRTHKCKRSLFPQAFGLEAIQHVEQQLQ